MKSITLIYGTTTEWINKTRSQVTGGANTLFFSSAETLAEFFQHMDNYSAENIAKTIFIVSTQLIAEVPIIGLLMSKHEVNVLVICHYEPERLIRYIPAGLNPKIIRES